ncbi:MAG: right-handed parallel beta-helix repeat-containing protein [Reichenbachiella sp.]
MNRMINLIKVSMWTALMLFMFSCEDEDEGNVVVIAIGENAAEEAQLAFINAEEGQTIRFEEGVYEFLNTLSMDGKNNVKIEGAGMGLTILNFSGQLAGGEGLLIANTDNVRIEGLTIQDAHGDALKSRECNRISFVDVGTVWTGEPGAENGAYGLYPVLCTEVFIDGCYAYGASDAGIYVGQSDQVIVKNSIAEGNVAGIEIENTTNADVFDNEAFDNTGGILVFDLPGLTQTGNSIRVFNNNCHDNNRVNFAPEGNIVANVPAGTGVMLLSTRFVEVFDNDIHENEFVGVLIASYLLINDLPDDPNYFPFPSSIYVLDNDYRMTAGEVEQDQPDFILDLMWLLGQYELDQPNVFIDGIFTSEGTICINEDDVSFINLNALEDSNGGSLNTDIVPFECERSRLPEIAFDPY